MPQGASWAEGRAWASFQCGSRDAAQAAREQAACRWRALGFVALHVQAIAALEKFCRPEEKQAALPGVNMREK
jgi:hypothetical protein